MSTTTARAVHGEDHGHPSFLHRLAMVIEDRRADRAYARSLRRGAKQVKQMREDGTWAQRAPRTVVHISQ